MLNRSKFLKGLLVLGLIVGLFFYFKPDTASVSIEDVSHLFVTNPSRNYSGAVLVNLDNDAENELFVSVIKDKNLFFKLKQGKLVPLQIPELEDQESSTFSVTACDIDNDGRDELLIINSGSNNSRIVKFVAGRWVDLLKSDSAELLDKLSGGFSATCIDRNGTGKFGFAVTSVDGPLLYIEYENQRFIDIAKEIGLGYKSKGRSIIGVPGPSGRLNIFVGNSGQSNFYFTNQGDGKFKENAADLGLADPTFEARGATLIDLNHDDLIDLAYGNHLGPLRLMIQSRSGKFEDKTPEDLAKHYAVNSIVVEDLNLDGFQDIYLNNVSFENELFLGADDHFSETDLGMLSEKGYFGVATIAADLNQDGSFEIFNTHGDGKNSKLTLYSIKAQKPWIRFRPILTSGGVPRGSVIKVRTNQRDLLLPISTGSGRFANYDDIVSMALLDKEAIVKVEVLLPSGQVKVVESDVNIYKINQINL